MMSNTFNLALSGLSLRNFEKHQDEIHRRTDRMFAWLMGFQYILAVVFALIVSPRTWEGASEQTHPHVWLALILGGALASFPIYLAIKHPGTAHTRHVIAASQALFSALLIHLTGGRIETHFHVFGSLAFLAFYRDWRVLITASVIVAADHFVRGAWFPLSVYGVPGGAEWRFLEHAGWVLFEDAFLILACLTGIREMKSMALRQAELQIAKEEIEEATANINQQSAVLNSVMTGMSDAIVVADLEGRYLHFNPAAVKVLGQAAREIPQSEWPQHCGLYADEDGNRYPSENLPLARAMRGESADMEQILVRREPLGGVSWIEISGRPLINAEGAHIGGVVVFRDITERKRILKESSEARRLAEQANKDKSDFLSRMSHELRTPMNSILGFSQLLQMDDLSEDQGDSVNQIVAAGSHLLKLINEVLDISRIEAGRLTLSLEPVELRGVVREVMSLLQPLAQKRDIQIFAEEPEGEIFVLADHQRLTQVLLNVVSNAIKYNVDGGDVRIEATFANDMVHLRVIDSGIGISPEKEALIFKPFERLGAEQSGVEGTGLGLAVSQRLMEAMNGQIELESSAAGASFVLNLCGATSPLRSLEQENWKEEPAPQAQPAAQSKLLLIEDNPANVKLVEKIFKSRPEYQLVVANNGLQGLEEAQSQRPDLILLDLNLPDISGSQVLATLKADPELCHIPIIVVSADATPSQLERLIADGAFAYVTKPLDVKSFLKLIAECTAPEKRIA